MLVKKAEFIISVAEVDKILPKGLPEIAIAGKSNVGKSSFINFLTGQKKLARTSSEPGRTRLLNYFKINDEFNLVDLPGYGFARVSDKEKGKWAKLIDTYLLESENLKHVFLLLDLRHEAGEHDKMLARFLYHNNIPFTIIATKADKMSRNAQEKAKTVLSASIGVGRENVLLTSSLSGQGRDTVEKRISQILE
ncbi:MAG: YihA family ribosome biogenesis GTP-binding protein [Clostridia bacterium]|nr:YihA family ribosome biogenesis GTP-binding protein [Clostridia bacterium]